MQMLTAKEEQIIDLYVDNRYYDVERLKAYLYLHEIVGPEVFQYCDRCIYNDGDPTYSSYLDGIKGYQPIPVSRFVKRIPFYFYTIDKSNTNVENMGILDYLFPSDKKSSFSTETLYTELEYAFYHLNLPLSDIFTYCINQTGLLTNDMFPQWCHYLHLCEEVGCTDYLPNQFISAYNEHLESVGLSPIIYEIEPATVTFTPFRKRGRFIEFDGRFPCDSNGQPIMKWIGVKASNIKSIQCKIKKSRSGTLTLEISPDTVVHVLNYYNESTDHRNEWYLVYAGPLAMQFDYSMLKYFRNQQGYSQQEIANAIGTSVRTYQKWESGETTPNGHFLLRLINWLDISDVQDLVEYIDIM